MRQSEDRPEVAVIIPAYNPSERLVTLVAELKRLLAVPVVVVDDGNDAATAYIWDTLENQGCIVLHHAENRGKGAAIVTAIRYLLAEKSGLIGYVTADADYQHEPNDICRVAQALRENPEQLALGVRSFSGRAVPFRSKLGNSLTSAIFRLQTGISLPDTQTGLRGVPIRFAGFCANIDGDRFEYEMNMLLKLVRKGVPLTTVPIATVYGKGLPKSNYRMFMDSARIFSQIVKFSSSSLVCAVGNFSINRSLVQKLLVFSERRGAK